MALSTKRECLRQVPWFSLTEWHQVYKQVYSNNAAEQIKAFETLLVWKARIPKLPVGIDCTLSIMQVCLRDREWTPEINSGKLHISYENDLCLMYSTTIMRFLNHITNIGQTKQASLFQIAKQLNIPEWIVNLRHDAAHGHEVPSIGVLRIAINILLTWLHEEYWSAEAKQLEEYYNNDAMMKEECKHEEVQAFSDVIELWTAVSLYIHADYHLVSDIPDSQLQETLKDLHSFVSMESEEDNADKECNRYSGVKIVDNSKMKNKDYSLDVARIILLSEISRYLSRKTIPNKEYVVFDALFNIEAFLPNADILLIFTQNEKHKDELANDFLPCEMIKFWEDIIILLHEKGLMEAFITELLKIVDKKSEETNRRVMASLWINSIIYGFLKLDVSQRISRNIEYKLKIQEQTVTQTILESKIKEEIESTYPHFKRVLRFDLWSTMPNFLMDINFFSRLILNINEFSIKFMSSIIELMRSRIDETDKQLLLDLGHLYVGKTPFNTSTNINKDVCQNVFTVEDINNLHSEATLSTNNNDSEKAIPYSFSDQTIRNSQCELASSNYQWDECPIGILPWQINSLEVLEPFENTLSGNTIAFESDITPGIIDSKDLKMRSQVNWDNILRKKRRFKRKQEQRNTDITVNRALETIKKKK